MLCEQIPEVEIVKTFNNPEKLLAEIPDLEFDLLISDIEMPGIDGLHLAEIIQNKLVIFCTAYKDYAADAFNIDAVDYITKPVKLDVDFGGINADPWGNTKAGFSFEGKIKRSDFGLNWNAALEAGGVMVSDEVKIAGELQFVKA